MSKNIWEKWKRKSGKSDYELSKELNLPEKTIKEIRNEERSVPTNQVDRVYKAFSTKSINKLSSLERAQIEQFFKDNSLKTLKKKFNYKNVGELSLELNISKSTLYNIFKEKEVKRVNENTLIKVYDFFQNEFNIKVKKNNKKINNKIAYRVLYKIILKSELPKEVIDWYKNTNIKQEVYNQNKSLKSLLYELGFEFGYYSTFVNFINKKNVKTSNWIIVQQLYNYFNNKELIDVKVEKPIKQEIKDKKELKDEVVDKEPNEVVIDKVENVPVDYTSKILETSLASAEETVPLSKYNEAIAELNRYKFLIDKLMQGE